MGRLNTNDLVAFLSVARERSFTRAAAKLDISPSALSHAMRGLEERLGIRLLNRTTRSVTPTEAGERLLQSVGPRFDEIEAELEALGNLRDKPTGTIRITTDENALSAVLWPVLREFLPRYPDITVETVIDNGLTDITAEGYDAGIRLGGIVAKDMIAAPIGPDMRMVAVAAPSYLEGRATPRTPQDLTLHRCINLRLPTHGGLYAWEFEKDGRELRIRVEGQLVFNSIMPMLEAALDGFGIAYLAQTQVQPHLDNGDLVQLLADWMPPFPGYHLYYPSRRQPTQAFTVLLDALRYRGPTLRDIVA
jgi:DNA-binding transcriptional LysR family regulator